jgi:hypothetical protein
MNGERKFIVVAVCLTIICVTILYSFLFLSLWDYRQLVGLSLLGISILGALVFLRGRLHEQDIRIIRYKHHEETPLDDSGEPMYYHEGYQPNPHRR